MKKTWTAPVICSLDISATASGRFFTKYNKHFSCWHPWHWHGKGGCEPPHGDCDISD